MGGTWEESASVPGGDRLSYVDSYAPAPWYALLSVQSIPGIKQPGHEVSYRPLPSAEIKGV